MSKMKLLNPSRVARRFGVAGVLVVAVLAFACLAHVAAKTSSGQAAQSDKLAPLEIKPAAGIDENLFLMRALEFTYERWPRNVTKGVDLQNWLVETRLRVSRLRAAIKANNLDASIGNLYDDCLGMLDSYETYLANLGAIDRKALLQAQQDAGKVVGKALGSGYDAGRIASDNGATNGESVGVGFAVGLLNGLFEDYQRSQARDEAKRAALEAEKRKVDARWSAAKANAEVAAEQLTARHSWKRGEAGFDGFTSKDLQDYVNRRPRDPFLTCAIAVIRVKGETPADVLADAQSCVEAARKVPPGSAYDCFRMEFLTAAADLAVLAAGRDLNNSAYSSGPAKSAPDAIRVCRTLLALNSSDPSGTGKMLLARALASAGRYGEAIEAANAVADKFRNNWGFCYRYARLMSLTNQLDHVGNWLKAAYANGFSDIDFVRNDADLANFRQGQPARFQDLTTVKFSWNVVFGIFQDDVVVTNNSPFDLTNITLDVTFPNGNRRQAFLTLDRLAPGQTHAWENVLIVPNGSVGQAVFNSKQGY